ncbi:hypothetical protein C8T65DRAFT_653632 [Cerioporus squamosus]|nr:hypothetical protein C8T65DRAFT_653632 [Cerioporus squamosus]
MLRLHTQLTGPCDDAQEERLRSNPSEPVTQLSRPSRRSVLVGRICRCAPERLTRRLGCTLAEFQLVVVI